MLSLPPRAAGCRQAVPGPIKVDVAPDSVCKPLVSRDQSDQRAPAL